MICESFTQEIDNYDIFDKSIIISNISNITKIRPQSYIENNIITNGQIKTNDYSLNNIILRINIILVKLQIAYNYDTNLFKWKCYWFNKGKICKFEIMIFENNKNEYIIDITKNENINFNYSDFLRHFKEYFLNIQNIPQSKFYSNYLLLDSNENSLLSSIYISTIHDFSKEFDKEININTLDFLLEILEYSNFHNLALTSGVHHKLIYLLFQLDYEKDIYYGAIDMILYLLFLLTQTVYGKQMIKKQKMLLDYLNKKIHQDIEYYELYTLEFSHLILSNII
jgi:hypothetical protein